MGPSFRFEPESGRTIRNPARERTVFRSFSSIRTVTVGSGIAPDLLTFPLERHSSIWTRKGRSSTLNLRIVLPKIDFDFRADAGPESARGLGSRPLPPVGTFTPP